MSVTDLLGSRRAAIVLVSMWLALAVIFAIDFIWLAWAGMRVTLPPSWPILLPIAALAFLSLKLRPERRVFMFTHTILFGAAATLALGWMNYVSTRLDMPLMDKYLITADHALGFDWREWLNFTVWHPHLQNLLSSAYSSLIFETFCLTTALALLYYPLEIERFLLAILLSSLMTVFIASLMPAVGGYVFYHLRPEMVLRYPAAGYSFWHDFAALRAHQLPVIPFPKQGLVTFPSFHTTTALLIIWISRCLKRWMIPVALWNALVIISCPVFGGHYPVDILGGAVVAAVTIAVVEKLLPYGLDGNYKTARPAAQNMRKYSHQ